MMKYLLSFICCVLVSSVVFATDDSDEYAIPTYKNYKFKNIKNVSVTVGCKKNDYPNSDTGDCQSWSITQKQGMYFFKHAKEVLPSVSELHDYDLTCCSAEGTIELSNGSKGVWEISPGGTGSLTVNPGKPNEHYIRLYCKTCDVRNLGSVQTPSAKDSK